MNKTRIRGLNTNKYTKGPVLYWMGRDHRVHDNWGLLAAQGLAHSYKVPLLVAFTLVPEYSEATIRQYGFLLRGLHDVENNLRKLEIPFILALGQPDSCIFDLVKKYEIGAVVTDFLPLRIIKYWKEQVAAGITIPMYQVDAQNIVPAWVASPKQEVGAYTLRPKLNKLLPEYLEDFPALKKQENAIPSPIGPVDWDAARASLKINTEVKEVNWLTAGENSAQVALKVFINERLEGYNTNRNIPGNAGQSDLSPYLHYGHIAPGRVALAVQASKALEVDKEAFLEELIVRRELSDNFCIYNENYDKLDGAPRWAQASLEAHRADKREILYDLATLETGATHDELWNAAQQEMLKRGKMHGYMRMYWAKKILEWSISPEEAIKTAIYLNDKYFIDGRDPNGYVGVLWSMAGLHDRPWIDRPIFGQIRYMNYNGAKRKFNIPAYCEYVRNL